MNKTPFIQIRAEPGEPASAAKCSCGCGRKFPGATVAASFWLPEGISTVDVAALCIAINDLAGRTVEAIVDAAQKAKAGTGAEIVKLINHAIENNGAGSAELKHISYVGAEADKMMPVFFPETHRPGGGRSQSN